MEKLTAKNLTRADWFSQRKPFDMMTCGDCLSLHATAACGCTDPAHSKLIKEVKKLKLTTVSNYESFAAFQKHFPIYVRLRAKYAQFYK